MNKRWWMSLAAIFIGVFVFVPHTAQAGVQDFTVSSFTADYYLTRNDKNASQLRVVETIVAEFPSFDQNHGILRAIPETYQDHEVDIKVTKVTDGSNKDISYSQSGDSGNVVLKIGDANKYVHGQQTYVIEYRMQNVTANFDGRDEFYWDVNGDQWMQPMQSVVARLHLSNDLAAQLQTGKACYTGVAGSTQQACSFKTEHRGGETIVTASADNVLQANETLTMALGFEPGTFAKYAMDPAKLAWIVAGIVAFGVLPPIAALVFIVYKWRKYGRDPKGRGTIVPEYIPPKDLGVLASDGLLKEKFDPASISAQIIDLAVRHYVKVYEVKKKKLFKDKTEYELELIKDPMSLDKNEQEVVKLIFGSDAQVGKRVALKDLSQKLYVQAQELGKHVMDRLTGDGYFVQEPGKAKTPYMVVGTILIVLGGIMLGWLIAGIGLGVAGLIILIGGLTMPQRTLKGVETRDYLLGLRDYMKLAEADRLKVLQSPQGTLTEKVDVNDTTQLVKLYERLLPYAMLFGIEKEWAKQFAHLYTQPPDWYSGSTAFNAAWFAGSLHNFGMTSAAQFAPPSSSGSSGSGGGGFSGGGGGGGGGGGW